MKNIVLVAIVALLSACITESESVFTSEAAPEEAAAQRVALARQYIGQRNWDDAKRNLKAAIAVNDTNPEVYEAFALVYQSTGEFELAEENYEKAINLDRDFSRARNNYATFLYSQERYREAEAQLAVVVKDSLYSSRAQAFVNLGLCRLRLFDNRGAEEAFVRSLAMERNNTIALLEVAQIRLEAGDSDNAALYYEQYRKRVPQQTPRALWLGIRLAEATGDSDAQSSYSMALTNLYPESAEYEAFKRSQTEN